MAGAFGTIAAGLGASIIDGIIGGSRSNGGGTDWVKTANAMQYQADLWKQNTQWYNNQILPDAYLRTRDALKKAGYNPLMGIGTPLADQGVMPNATVTEGTKSTSIQRLSSAQQKNIEQDTNLKTAQVDETISSARLKDQQAISEENRRNLMNAQTDYEKAHKEYTEALKKYQDKEINNYELKMYFNMEQEAKRTMIMQQNANSQYLQAEASKTSSSANMITAKEKQDRDSWSFKTPLFSYSREGKRKTSDNNYNYEPYSYDGKGNILYKKYKK